jgi:probable F420-dependent oxidoreductase
VTPSPGADDIHGSRCHRPLPYDVDIRFGLYAINYGTCGDPESLVRVAQHAEASGLDSLWAGEHIVLPDPPGDYPIAPEIPFLDAVVALTLAAANTTSITLGTGILELPLHQPVLLAKQLASVDQISNGRLVVGVGVGYLAVEFGAMGVPLDERATRTDEYLEAMRALWTMAEPEFHGRHVDFAGIDANPRPQQEGGPPILIGGNSALARRRAIRSARGWIPADFDIELTRQARVALDRDLAEIERPASLGPFEFTVISPTNRLTRELIDDYRTLGVDRLIVLPGLDVPTELRYHAVGVDEVVRTIDHLAELAHD